MPRTRVTSGTKWEPLVGYSRAVRVDRHVYVSGTTGTGPDGEVVEGGVYEQTIQAIRNIEMALGQAGARMADVVRTRIYLTDITDWEPVGRAHGEFFGEIRPATTLVEVSRLIGPRILIEIEAEAIVEE